MVQLVIWLDDQGIILIFQPGTRDFYLLHKYSDGLWGPPNFLLTKGYRLFFWGKLPGRKLYHSPLSSVSIKNALICYFFPPHHRTLMTCTEVSSPSRIAEYWETFFFPPETDILASMQIRSNQYRTDQQQNS